MFRVILILAFLLLALPALAADSDTCADAVDNCKDFTNADQRDPEADGYGSACDADWTNDGTVSASDFVALSAAWGCTPSDSCYDEDIDTTGDGLIGSPEFTLLSVQFGGPPGPSGLSCAGNVGFCPQECLGDDDPANGENRCDLLGDECLCAEAMNVNETATGNWNPSDSTGDKECTDVALGGAYTVTGGAQTATTSLDGYGGSDPPSFVHQTPGSQATILTGAEGVTSVMADAHRYCTRWYMRYMAEYECPSKVGCDPCSCVANDGKVFEFAGVGNEGHQWTINTSVACPVAGVCTDEHRWKVDTDSEGFTPGKWFFFDPSGSGPVGPQDCKEGVGNGDGWCRFEFCAGGDLDGGGDRYYDFRVVSLENGEMTHNTTSTYAFPVGEPHDVHHVNIWNDLAGANAQRQLSHFMEAAWETDEGQWVGPATEIEGP